MDLFSIIISLLVLGAVGLVGKKTSKESAPRKKATAQGQNRPSFGDLIAEMLGEAVTGNIPKGMSAAEPVVSNRQETKIKKQQKEYFSYENQGVDWNAPKETFYREPSDSMIFNKEEALFESSYDGKLDLRSAFIYQTILENKYITY